jgi:hypothetical protein
MGIGPVEQNIGLGDANHIKRLTVRWPDGSTQEFTDLEVNHRYQIIENNAALQSIPLEQSTGPVPRPD